MFDALFELYSKKLLIEKKETGNQFYINCLDSSLLSKNEPIEKTIDKDYVPVSTIKYYIKIEDFEKVNIKENDLIVKIEDYVYDKSLIIQDIKRACYINGKYNAYELICEVEELKGYSGENFK